MAEANLENLPLDERVRRIEREQKNQHARLARLEKTQTAVNQFLAIVPGLVKLQEHAERLSKLADIADEIVQIVRGSNDDDIFWAELWRRIGLTTKPGKLFWSLVLVVAGGLAGGWAYWAFAPGGH